MGKCDNGLNQGVMVISPQISEDKHIARWIGDE
jgi:hypothetical protein